MPLIISSLERAGIRRDNIKVIIALGGHRPMTRQDMVKKLGEDTVRTIQIINHSPFRNDLVFVGFSSSGYPIKVHPDFAAADLKLSVGCIVPHSGAGFSGGAKCVIPGIASIDTLVSNHSANYNEVNGKKYSLNNIGNPDCNLRLDMEEIAHQAGLEFIVNVVVNSKLMISGLFAGDPVNAHRTACLFARKVYSTKIIHDADILILNAFPKDTEYTQIMNAFTVLGANPGKQIPNKSSIIVLATAAAEGAGYHAVNGPGMPLFITHDNCIPPLELAGIKTIIYSTGVSPLDIKQFCAQNPPVLYNNWDVLLKFLINEKGNHAKVAIYPLASIQFGE
jgi:nickel-dependent lactate racemase